MLLFLWNLYFHYFCIIIYASFMSNLTGSKQEQQELKDLYESVRAEFVAVYRCRRVGNT